MSEWKVKSIKYVLNMLSKVENPIHLTQNNSQCTTNSVVYMKFSGINNNAYFCLLSPRRSGR